MKTPRTLPANRVVKRQLIQLRNLYLAPEKDEVLKDLQGRMSPFLEPATLPQFFEWFYRQHRHHKTIRRRIAEHLPHIMEAPASRDSRKSSVRIRTEVLDWLDGLLPDSGSNSLTYFVRWAIRDARWIRGII